MEVSLPIEYERFIETNGRFEGFTSGEPGYIQLWKIDDLSSINSEMLIEEMAPGYLAFASDGGNEVLAFDRFGIVYKLPMIGMESRYAIKIANSFSELAARFEKRIQESYKSNLTRKY